MQGRPAGVPLVLITVLLLCPLDSVVLGAAVARTKKIKIKNIAIDDIGIFFWKYPTGEILPEILQVKLFMELLLCAKIVTFRNSDQPHMDIHCMQGRK